MTRSVTFTVIGIAQPQGSSKAFMPPGARFPVVTSDNPKNKGWRQCVAEQAQQVAAEGQFLGPVAMFVRFSLPRPLSLPRRHHGARESAGPRQAGAVRG